jgi:alpha-glucosidase
MIKAIPAVWDETIVLGGSEIGEVAALARRSGDAWFVAVVNGPAARTLQVPLSFLDGPDPYAALVVRDGKDNPDAVELDRLPLRRTDTLTIDLPAGGGYVARLTR